MSNLRKLTQEELNVIVERHQHYLNKDCDNWEQMKADLSKCNLSGLNLTDADLSDAKNIQDAINNEQPDIEL